MVELIPQDRLYLDDLYVGQRFASATDTIDEAQIKAFAARFDPQPFHIDEKAAMKQRAKVRAMGAEGMTRTAIAAMLGISERSVYRALVAA